MLWYPLKYFLVTGGQSLSFAHCFFCKLTAGRAYRAQNLLQINPDGESPYRQYMEDLTVAPRNVIDEC